jgi:hypothetical protein
MTLINEELESIQKEDTVTYHALNALSVDGLETFTMSSWPESLLRVQLFLLKLFEVAKSTLQTLPFVSLTMSFTSFQNPPLSLIV